MKQGKFRFEWNILSSFPVFIALIIIASTPIFYLKHEEQIANQIAQYAFYILTIGILLKTIQLLVDKHSEDTESQFKGLEGKIE